MEEKNLWILLGKHLNGEVTEKERQELQKLIQKNRDNLSYLIEFLEDQWKPDPPIKGIPENALLNERWDHLSERILNETYSENEQDEIISPKSYSARISPAWFKMAAAILLLMGGAYFLVQQLTPNHHLKQYEITAGSGVKKHIELPDGTGVWLNADSRLSYDNEFDSKNRAITIEGEAYFQVRKDAVIPFTVNAGGITIKVLGTVFNVSAYKNDPDIQTTLISGKVQVSINDDPGKRIVLTPHEKLTVMNDQHTAIKTIDSSAVKTTKHSLPAIVPEANELKYQVQTLPVNPVDSTFFTETAWVDNKLAFVYEPFSEVAKMMERRYNIHIIFKNNDLKKVVMSGVFDKETVKQAMQVLQMITPFNYKETGDSIYLYK